MVPDTEILTRMSRSLAAWQHALGRAAAGGEVIEIGELVASIVPAAPSRSILNAAVAPYGSKLDEEALEELAGRYAAAGISGWGMWVHERDSTAGAALEAAGLTVDSRPTAMAVDLQSLAPAQPLTQIEVERTDDVSLLARPLGEGYGFPPELITQGLHELTRHCEGWVARVEGTPAAALALVRHERDAGVFMLATAPAMRRRGAAAEMLRRALLSARERGSTSSTLQSSAMGQALYEGIGYEAHGAYVLWERRAR
jgi:GNAT superfamily N-acetyltransferase